MPPGIFGRGRRVASPQVLKHFSHGMPAVALESVLPACLGISQWKREVSRQGDFFLEHIQWDSQLITFDDDRLARCFQMDSHLIQGRNEPIWMLVRKVRNWFRWPSSVQWGDARCPMTMLFFQSYDPKPAYLLLTAFQSSPLVVFCTNSRIYTF